jgi:hypothetical protein
MKLYVAYGSNLNLAQMEHRCPDARIVGKGVVQNYGIKYRGSKTGAYATIIKEKGKTVPVLVWSISGQDERNLDIYEGFPRFYYKKQVTVQMENGKRIRAMAYIMFDAAKPGIPSDYYIRTILEGYIANKLDINVLLASLDENDMEVEVCN